MDTGTRFSVPYLLEALKARGLSPEQVRYLLVTHIHLDHSGGAAELLKHCPNATVIAHPRASRHLADPSRLVARPYILACVVSIHTDNFMNRQEAVSRQRLAVVRHWSKDLVGSPLTGGCVEREDGDELPVDTIGATKLTRPRLSRLLP